MHVVSSSSSLQVRYTGYRAISAGLQADTFVEAFDIEKQKLEYGALIKDAACDALVSRCIMWMLCLSVCLSAVTSLHRPSS